MLATYRDDFSKYSSRIATERLDEVMTTVPRMLGQKFVFSKVNKAIQAATIKQILKLLEKAYPNKTKVDVKDNLGNQVKYTLISIPFYLVRQIHRLLDLVLV